MRCSTCGFENRKHAKFCGGCGMLLALNCPECGNEISPSNRFCDSCGADVGRGSADAAPESETRQPRGPEPGAIVVPMPSSSGCVGVVSAELRHGRENDPATLALARILAAQLAMLTGARG